MKQPSTSSNIPPAAFRRLVLCALTMLLLAILGTYRAGAQIEPIGPTPLPTPTPSPTEIPPPPTFFQGNDWDVSWNDQWAIDSFNDISSYDDEVFLTIVQGPVTMRFYERTFTDWYDTSDALEEVVPSIIEGASSDNPFYGVIVDTDGTPLLEQAPDHSWVLVSGVIQTNVGPRPATIYVDVRRLVRGPMLVFYAIVAGDDPATFNAYLDTINGVINSIHISTSPDTADQTYTNPQYGWSVSWSSAFYQVLMSPHQTSNLRLGWTPGESTFSAEFITIDQAYIDVNGHQAALVDPQHCRDEMKPAWDTYTLDSSAYLRYPAIFDDSSTRASGLFVNSDETTFYYVDCRILVPGEAMLVVFASESVTDASFGKPAIRLIKLLDAIDIPAP